MQVTTPRWLIGTYPYLHTRGTEDRPFSIKQVDILVYFRTTDGIYVYALVPMETRLELKKYLHLYYNNYIGSFGCYGNHSL